MDQDINIGSITFGTALVCAKAFQISVRVLFFSFLYCSITQFKKYQEILTTYKLVQDLVSVTDKFKNCIEIILILGKLKIKRFIMSVTFCPQLSLVDVNWWYLFIQRDDKEVTRNQSYHWSTTHHQIVCKLFS